MTGNSTRSALHSTVQSRERQRADCLPLTAIHYPLRYRRGSEGIFETESTPGDAGAQLLPRPGCPGLELPERGSGDPCTQKIGTELQGAGELLFRLLLFVESEIAKANQIMSICGPDPR
jgi:hypothetical protein